MTRAEHIRELVGAVELARAEARQRRSHSPEVADAFDGIADLVTNVVRAMGRQS